MGKVIGARGWIINEIKQRSGAMIQTMTGRNEIHILGPPDSRSMAAELVRAVLADGPGAMDALVKDSNAVTRTVECPLSAVHVVIGPRGQTINGLERQSGASIKFDDNTTGNPRIIYVRGTDATVSHAIKLIEQMLSKNVPDSVSSTFDHKTLNHFPFKPVMACWFEVML